MSELRCEQERSGVRCGLPSGHSGQHQNGPLVVPWSDALVDPRREKIDKIIQDYRGFSNGPSLADAILAALEEK